MAEDPPCLYVLSAENNDLGIRDCSSVRKDLSNRSTSGLFAFAWKSHDRGATLSSLTWPSTASFAPATWLNFDQTTFAREQRCGIEQRSFKRRQVDQSSSKSRSSRGTPLKPGYQCSGPLAPDISSQVDFTQGPTYPRANMPGRCIAGLKASALESASYGTHSMRRTKAAQIYRKTGNLRAVQLLLGHTKLESTVRYLGIEADDALNIAEQIEL